MVQHFPDQFPASQKVSIYLSAEHYRDLDFRSGSRAFFRLFSVGVEELAEDRKCAYGANNINILCFHVKFLYKITTFWSMKNPSGGLYLEAAKNKLKFTGLGLTW